MSDTLNITNTTSERVFRALKEARSKLEAIEEARKEQIAIIGMAGKFPGADNLDEFWELLVQGRSGIRMLSETELLEAGVPESTFTQPNYVPAYASFTDPTQFDAHFFGYSPREAELIDPQHRVFLECAWAALENAGYDSHQYDGTIGVYGGAALNSYLVNLYANATVRDSVDPVQAVISNVMGLMPTRVSYQLDLKGPSCGIQTGCSTALVAVHTACQSLLHHECDMALAGGVTVSSAIPQGYLYQPDGIAAPDGVCRAFDAMGQGTLFGNGVGLVVLKRLQAAVRDGDHIYAVIKGSAINNDGADKVGLTAPSISGQAAVIQAAFDQAGIDPSTLSYIEGHGTGTPLGDPIEIAALNKVFNRASSRPCALGSVKTNVGHLDAAAGVAGLIKTVLAMQNRVLPPSLNFKAPNPRIAFEQGPFVVNDRCTDWVSTEVPRRAGVSSFGMGGTNAHVILEEAPVPKSTNKARPWQMLTLSAKTPTALMQMRQQLATHLKDHPEQDLADIAYTLQIGRRSWPHRQICLCQTTTEAIELLNQADSPLCLSQTAHSETHSIVFMFSGQGAQHVNMGRDLYETEPVFRQAMAQCADLLGSDFPLLEILYGVKRDRPETQSSYPLTHTANAQPTLFAVEYALAKLWLSWGIQPKALIGHSIGEYVAACIAGVFSLADALALVTQRGRIMQSCSPGAMLSILQPASSVRTYLPVGAEIAVINSPQTCVVSGPIRVIEALRSQLESQSIPCRRLETSHAFHSASMDSALGEFGQVLQKVALHPPQIEIISNVTGTWLTDTEATSPDYWLRHLRHTVHFSQGITELLHLDHPIFLEIGPGHTLTKLVQQHLAPEQRHIPALQSLPHPRENQADLVTMMMTLGKLWLTGITDFWQDFHASTQRQRLPLPTYPFEHQSYWIPLEQDAPAQVTPEDESSKKPDLSDWFYLPTWKRLPLIEPPSNRLDSCWLIFTDGVRRESLWSSLEDQINNLTWVTPGDEFLSQNNVYTLNPHQANDYQLLLQALQGESITQVVYDWGGIQALAHLDPLESLLHLIQSLSGQKTTLSLITTNVQNVTGTESINPLMAKILGFGQVISQEYPQLRSRFIDIDDSCSPPMVTKLGQELRQEYNPEQRILAYREGHRWVQTYDTLPLPPHQSSLLKPGGTYLIAGDIVEGLGTVYAKALVQDLDAKLILVGRPGLPAASDWEKWLLTHGPQHSVSRLIRQLQALGTEGETFLWFSGDLTDLDWTQATLHHGLERFGPIVGVFHTDVMGDQASCAMAELDAAACDRICRTKVEGIQVLQQALSPSPVDFYLLQSSLSSIVGGIGFGAYAAANGYLDAFAQQQHNQTTQWLSLNWDACELDKPATQTQSTLMSSAMSADEVWEVTQRALSQSSCPQLIISPRSLQARLDKAFVAAPEKVDNFVSDVGSASHTRPPLSTPYVAPTNEVEQTVALAMGELLGIEAVGINDNFFELGGHSLLAIQAVTRLRQEFQVDLPMRAFLFEAPTVAGIAKIITENQIILSDDTQSTLEDLLGQIENMPLEEVEKKL
ncbi:type I polyketide synthase [Acaryochloris sp. IP29b_bin.137]|uniref:type I polyketide synthase n=1 Tax=Acaryochloris sp. IP29b_bin.137 TaxID=2969217 RepID=UPI00261C4F6F|nr:type I polyketide synthase [Acaryochloris sp. IP29b_bin.137]